MKHLEEKLKNTLTEKRFFHTIRVKDTAVILSKIYNVSEEETILAALLHDYGKHLNYADSLKMIQKFGIILDDETLNSPEIIHASIAASIAKVDFNINNQDVLNAITYHTTGRENMSLLEKIIYLADYIEPNRDFPRIDNIRDMAYKDLDKAVFMAMNNTINYLIDNNMVIHTNTIKGRNYLLKLHKWRF